MLLAKFLCLLDAEFNVNFDFAIKLDLIFMIRLTYGCSKSRVQNEQIGMIIS